MGEAKRRKSGQSIAMEPVNHIDVFDPRALKDGADVVRRETVIESIKRSRMRPTPICGACDYEFTFGELPALLYAVRPFIDPGRAFQFVSGFVCRSCATDPEVAFKIFAYLRKHNPHLQLLEPGTS